jgi:hypothetical protein
MTPPGDALVVRQRAAAAELAALAETLPGPARFLLDALRAEIIRRASLGDAGPSGLRHAIYQLRERARLAQGLLPPTTTRGVRVLVVPRLNHADVMPIVRALGWPALTLVGPRDHLDAQSSVTMAGLCGPAFLPALGRAITASLGLRRTLAAAERPIAAIAARVVADLGVPALVLAGGVDRLLAAGEVEVVLAGSPYTWEGRTALMVARARRCLAVTVEHGTIDADDPAWQQVPADLVCAWGASSQSLFIGNGLPASSVVVTGSARHDAASQKVASVAREPLVVVATSGAGGRVSLEAHTAFIAALLAAARQRPELRFLVKLHRKDRTELYAAASANVALATPDPRTFGSDLLPLLARASALVTVQSAAGLEAVLAGVPVVCVDVTRSGGHRAYPFLEHTAVAHDGDELAACLARIDDLPRAPAALLDHHMAHRGSAAEMAAAAIRARLAAAGLPKGGHIPNLGPRRHERRQGD